jgi:Zn-dependent protease with chaperone function
VTTPLTPPLTCPNCSLPLTGELGAVPWCERCEWNLAAFDPARMRTPFGWRWTDRLMHRLAFRLNGRQFAALSGRAVGRPGWDLSRTAVVALSLLLVLVIVALLGLGLWLIGQDFPSLMIIPGIGCVALAVLLRPEFGRADPYADVLTREGAPTLFALLDRVAAEVGAAMPHVVTVSTDFNASAGAVGLRRRRVLTVGLPMWFALPPQQRVALLGHEFGHFVNGDVRRGALTQIAFTSFGKLAMVTAPTAYVRAVGLIDLLANLFARLAMRIVSWLFYLAHLVVVLIGLRSIQRAEYHADELAARVAGTEAAMSLLDLLAAADAMASTMRVAARNGDELTELRARASSVRAKIALQRSWRRQLSTREEASLFSSHPPSGLRARLVESRHWQAPAITMSQAESDRIDAELLPTYTKRRRDIGVED